MPGRAEDGRRPSPLFAGLRFDGRLRRGRVTWSGVGSRRRLGTPGLQAGLGRPRVLAYTGPALPRPPLLPCTPAVGFREHRAEQGAGQTQRLAVLRGSGDRRGLCPAPPPPGGRAVAGFGSRLKGRGVRPAQASARRRNREGEGAGCQRRRPEGGAFSLSGFLLRNTWFLQVRETQASERGAALPEGAAAPSRPRPPIRGPQHLRVLNHRLFDARPPRFGFVTFGQM